MAVRSTILSHTVDAGGTMTTTIPADWEEGDIIMVGTYIGGVNPVLGTGPSAFDLLLETGLGNTQGIISLHMKEYEAGDVSWTWGVAQDTRGMCAAAFYDVAIVAEETSADGDIFSAGTPITLPGFTNDEQDAVVVIVSGARFYSVGDRGPTQLTSVTSDQTYTILYYDDQAPSAGGRLGFYMAYTELPIGDVDDVTLVWDNTGIGGGNIGEAVLGARALLSTVDLVGGNVTIDLNLLKLHVQDLPYFLHREMLD